MTGIELAQVLISALNNTSQTPLFCFFISTSFCWFWLYFVLKCFFNQPSWIKCRYKTRFVKNYWGMRQNVISCLFLQLQFAWCELLPNGLCSIVSSKVIQTDAVLQILSESIFKLQISQVILSVLILQTTS